jgi:hypothetical protein
MTPLERRNEHLKLVANWSNTLATAIMTAGSFIPAAQFLYGILDPAKIDVTLVYGAGVICIGVGVLIHLFGQWMLGGLR